MTDNIENENKNNIEIIQSIDTSSLEDLFDDDVEDKKLAIPSSKLRKVSALLDTDKPLIPLPVDLYTDVVYTQNFESKCVLCKSPWRSRAEHHYLQEGRKATAVQKFFEKYLGATLTWESVQTHMKYHCNMERISTSGLKNLAKREAEIAERWRYRENDLVITGLMSEIDIIGGLQFHNHPELELKRAGMMSKLLLNLRAIVKDREESGLLDINVMTILQELLEAMPTNETKQIILNKVSEIREKLSEI